jgi:hypothetical protein
MIPIGGAALMIVERSMPSEFGVSNGEKIMMTGTIMQVRIGRAMDSLAIADSRNSTGRRRTHNASIFPLYSIKPISRKSFHEQIPQIGIVGAFSQETLAEMIGTTRGTRGRSLRGSMTLVG